MGAWGYAPWDNDAAADWFGDLFAATQLAQHVEDTLELDPESEHEQIRAAAFILVSLGRTYIWPVDHLDRHLQTAISKLEIIRENELFADTPEFVESIESEIAALKSRLRPL